MGKQEMSNVREEDLEKEESGNVFWHYTNEKGKTSIMEFWHIKESETGSKGRGVYITTLKPVNDEKKLALIGKLLYGKGGGAAISQGKFKYGFRIEFKKGARIPKQCHKDNGFVHKIDLDKLDCGINVMDPDVKGMDLYEGTKYLLSKENWTS